MKIKSLKSILPFLDDEDLEELALKCLENEERTFKDISLKTLLPFLDEDFIYDKLFKHELKENKDVTYMFPFIDDDAYDDYVLNSIKNNNFDEKIYSMLPFLDEDTLSKIVKAYLDDEIDIDINRLYPYLDDDDIKKIFKKALDD